MQPGMFMCHFGYALYLFIYFSELVFLIVFIFFKRHIQGESDKTRRQNLKDRQIDLEA